MSRTDLAAKAFALHFLTFVFADGVGRIGWEVDELRTAAASVVLPMVLIAIHIDNNMAQREEE